jgi:hypothetical protein
LLFNLVFEKLHYGKVVRFSLELLSPDNRVLAINDDSALICPFKDLWDERVSNFGIDQALGS